MNLSPVNLKNHSAAAFLLNLRQGARVLATDGDSDLVRIAKKNIAENTQASLRTGGRSIDITVKIVYRCESMNKLKSVLD